MLNHAFQVNQLRIPQVLLFAKQGGPTAAESSVTVGQHRKVLQQLYAGYRGSGCAVVQQCKHNSQKQWNQSVTELLVPAPLQASLSMACSQSHSGVKILEDSAN